MNTINWTDNIPTLPTLAGGAHDAASGVMCAMELVAFMERLPHSDHPECTCPAIAAYVRGLNDAMTDVDRQSLMPYLSRLVGTVSPEHEQERATLAAMRAVNVFAAAALTAVGLDDHAEACRRAPTLPLAMTAAAAAADAGAGAAAGAAAAAGAGAGAGAAAWTDALALLDDMLAVGPVSAGWSVSDVDARVAELVSEAEGS